jgi:Tol biopolymer transport system component
MFLAVQSVRKPQASETIQRISAVPSGAEDNYPAHGGQFSLGGRYIAFNGEADFVPNLPDHSTRIFLKDTLTGSVSLVSVTQQGVLANSDSEDAAISANGRFVVFRTSADNLVEGDTNTDYDIFLKDLSTGRLTRVSTNSQGDEVDGQSFNPQVSADGRYVVFENDANTLVDGTTLGRRHIYRKDTWSGETKLVSASQGGVEGHDVSENAQISADGRYVVFETNANNLAGTDLNGFSDIYRKDMVTGAVTLVSGSGTALGDNHSRNPHITPDGRYVVFESSATNLGGGLNGTRDIFRKDLQTGEIILVSAAANGVAANASSEGARISADGRYVIFKSDASNLVAGSPTGTKNVFVKDLVTGALTALTLDGGSDREMDAPHISPDGRYALFTSASGNLVPGDTNEDNDVFRVDLLYKANAAAIAEGRFVETTLSVGAASSATIAWGDGTSSTVTPAGGSAAFSHAYASTGVKAATVILTEGALTWNVAHTIDTSTSTMVRNTVVADTLSGGAGSDSLTGDAFANILIADAGNDWLSGLSGNDRLDAGSGNDSLYGGTDNDTLDGSSGNDRLYAESGNDSLSGGGGGNDLLSAGTGNDRLSGGTGKDTLTGSTGRDTFVFDDRETGSSKSKADYITDFSDRRGDKIDLKAVDANTRKRGDQKFSFIGDDESFSKAGEVRFEKTKKYTYVYLNTDNDRSAEAVIKLKGALELQKSWFVL